MTIRAKFRVAGITWEQSIVAFLTKYPGSTAEEVNNFAQHPDLKNFSTILSAMKKDGHLKRDENRPTRWTVKSTNRIPVPELEVTHAGPVTRVAQTSAASVPSGGMQVQPTSGGGNLVALVQNVLATEQAAKVARGAFDALLPGLDAASKSQLFNMLAKSGKPVETVAARPVPAVQKDGRIYKRSSEEIKSLVQNIVGLLAKAPEGLRAEQLRDELGIEAKELPRPIQIGLETRAFRKRGLRRSTTYFLAPPKGTTKAKSTKKASNKDASPEAGEVAPGSAASATVTVEAAPAAVLTAPVEVEKTPEPVAQAPVETAVTEPAVETAAPLVTLRTEPADGDEKLVFEAVRSFGTNNFKLAAVCERAGLSSTVVQPFFTKFRKEGLITQSRTYTTHNREWVNVTEKKSQTGAEAAA